MVVLVVEVPVSRGEVSCGQSHLFLSSLELSPHFTDHLLRVWGDVFLLHQLQVIHVWLLLQGDFCLKRIVLTVESGDLVDEVVRVLSSRVRLLLLSDVVRTLTERGLPVLLVQVRVVRLVQRAGAWCWVTIFNHLWHVVVVVTFDADTHSKSFEPRLASGFHFGH